MERRSGSHGLAEPERIADAGPSEPEAEAARALAAYLAGSSDGSRLVELILPILHLRVARALFRRRSAALGRDVRQETADLVQEVLIALFASDAHALRTWDPARGLSLHGFVGLLAEREVSSILRSRRRSPWTEDPTLAEDLEPQGEAVSAELAMASRQILERVLDEVRARLSPKGLHLFQLLVVEERSIAEVSQQLGMTADALYAWRSRLGRLIRTIAAEAMSDTPAAPRTSSEEKDR